MLDLNLRFRVHALEGAAARDQPAPAFSTSRPACARCRSTTTPACLRRDALLEALDRLRSAAFPPLDDIDVPSRIVHLPLSWDDPATQLAIRKYMQSVRPDAPWCPSNIEFIRRINGLDSIDDVRRIVFDANYLVLGLGDVYLGAPVATPVDPRHRLVTTKYNPARTWTPENAVGIGGAYLCVYGMEGPGGYQFVGRTRADVEHLARDAEFEPGTPWLLRFFDQIRFYPVSPRNCSRFAMRSRTAVIRCASKPQDFRLQGYHAFLDSIEPEAAAFKRTPAASRIRSRARTLGRRRRRSSSCSRRTRTTHPPSRYVPEGCQSRPSPGHRQRLEHRREPGERVEAGQKLIILEAMKMEIAVAAPNRRNHREAELRTGRPGLRRPASRHP